jgi:plasmid stabilization system protein ParE
MRLRFTARATRELTQIADYLRERNPAASKSVRSAFLGTLQTIVQFPEIGRRQTVEGVRKSVTRRYGYLVYYAVDRERAEIIVLAIRHPRQQREFSDR